LRQEFRRRILAIPISRSAEARISKATPLLRQAFCAQPGSHSSIKTATSFEFHRRLASLQKVQHAIACRSTFQSIFLLTFCVSHPTLRSILSFSFISLVTLFEI
jgi:hypothetical protein